MKRIFLLILSLFFSYNCLAFEFHGYIRSGFLSGSEPGSPGCFKLPGAGSKYRLGNECETYGELSFSEELFKTDQAGYIKTSAMIGFLVPGSEDFETDEPSFREVYVEAGNLFESGVWQKARFWAGKRYYQRHDVHLIDFFYWNNSGPGAGIENIKLLSGSLSWAIRQNNISDTRSIMSQDIRLAELAVNKDAELTLGINIISAHDREPGFSGSNGSQLHIQHHQKKILGGFNKLTLQFGKGAGAALNDATDDTLDESAKTIRLVEQLVFEPTNNWSGELVLVHEDQQNSQLWQSYGIRPIYHFSDHINLAVELGVDNVTPDTGATRTMTKLTIAPQLTKARGYFSRPLIRAFITYAEWNQAARDAADVTDAIHSNNIFGLSHHGYNIGIQAEAWW